MGREQLALTLYEHVPVLRSVGKLSVLDGSPGKQGETLEWGRRSYVEISFLTSATEYI